MVFINNGFTDMIDQFAIGDAYSFVFSGQWGYLDHGLASAALAPFVTGATEWHINADEVNLLDYNDTIQDPGEASFNTKPPTNPLYAPDAFRASDHDPLIVGLSLPSLCDFNVAGGDVYGASGLVAAINSANSKRKLLIRFVWKKGQFTI